MKSENIEKVADACRKGNLEDFGLLFDAFHQKIYRFVYFRTHHRETAEDITSQIFTKALEHISSFDPSKASFSTWLYQIARNSLIDNYKSNRPVEPPEQLEDISSNQNLERQTEAVLNLEKVKKFLSTLDEEKREVVTMRVWDGLSYKEIAEVLGRTESSCKMTFVRAMEKLNKEAAFALLYLLMLKAG
jgi:RNA polymerase sigma-70 factor (ECF subfamily)